MLTTDIDRLRDEIRRLRAAERNYQAAHDLQDTEIERLRATNAALMAALKEIAGDCQDGMESEIARAAIAKAGGPPEGWTPDRSWQGGKE